MSTGPVADVAATAVGRLHRDDPVAPGTGGPAGNARLTAWLGLILLVLFVAECVTLLDLHGLISWHLVLGTVLVPLTIAKTLVTGWRIARYYTGSAAYRQAGPPPLLLRLLGPLVVLTGLAVLGTGLALVALGSSTFTPIVTIAGQQVTALMLHKLTFVAWLLVVGAHTLVRLVPALQLTIGRKLGSGLPGPRTRAAILALTLVLGVGGGFVLLDHAGYWSRTYRFSHDNGPDR